MVSKVRIAAGVKLNNTPHPRNSPFIDCLADQLTNEADAPFRKLIKIARVGEIDSTGWMELACGDPVYTEEAGGTFTMA